MRFNKAIFLQGKFMGGKTKILKRTVNQMIQINRAAYKRQLNILEKYGDY